MRTVCEEPWRHRVGSSSLQEVVAFRADELILGCGTILWKAASGPSKILSLSSDAAHDRLVALLVVAGRGHLAKAALLQLDTALNEWQRGDHALAAIRLAFVRLPAIRDLDEAHTLFLAETALDAGLRPNELLKALGYAGGLPLLKDVGNEARVPRGSGRASGQWTSGAPVGGSAPTPVLPTAKPVVAGELTLKPRQVLFRPEGGDAEESDVKDKAHHLLDNSVEQRILEGRPTPKQVPGAFEIEPLPEGGGRETTAPTVPQTDAVPNPQPKPAPGGGGSSTDDPARDGEGSACPAQQKDRSRGPNANADLFEYLMSLIVNPLNPTPKQSPFTPSVVSQAYYLSTPTPDGKTSYDDCKQDSSPIFYPGGASRGHV